jgi:biotin carboxylase
LKTILFISAGIESIPGIKLANEMGYHTVATDKNKNAPGFQFSNDKIIASTYDIKETLAEVIKYHKNNKSINGVISIAADVPMTVSSVAEKLGLACNSLSTSILSSDKIKMKEVFKNNKVPTPEFRQINSYKEFINICNNWSFPLIIKPSDSRGARGVLQINEKVDLKWAYDHSLSYSSSKKLIVEKYILGPQISTESIIYNGTCTTVGFSDRNYEYLEKYFPHIIENGGDLPASLSKSQEIEINNIIKNAAHSLGVERGVVKGDIVISNGEPIIIEMATRLSGGYFCSHEIPLSTGVDFVGNAIKIAMGENINIKDLYPKFSKNICQRYIFPKEGKIKKINGLELLKQKKDIEFFKMFIKNNDIIKNYTSHISRAGVIIASGNSRQEAIKNVEEAVKLVTFDYHR